MLNIYNVISLIFISVLFFGCAINFTNASTYVAPEYRKVYVPAATDVSSFGGNSARISYILRKKISENTRFLLTDSQDARIGIDVKILDRKNPIVLVETCVASSTVKTIGAGAFNCDKNLIYQPSLAAEKESFLYAIEVSAIDLVSGKTLKRERMIIPPTDYYVIADSAGDGARIRAELIATPQLHSLRYAENRDNAITLAADKIATLILTFMESIGPMP